MYIIKFFFISSGCSVHSEIPMVQRELPDYV